MDSNEITDSKLKEMIAEQNRWLKQEEMQEAQTSIEDLKKQRSILWSAQQRVDDVSFLRESQLQLTVDAISAKLSMAIDDINKRICEIAVENGLDQLEELG